jgi:hypothetical protein
MSGLTQFVTSTEASTTRVQTLLIRLGGITAGDYLTWVRDPEPPALDHGLRSVAISAEPLGELVNIELIWAEQPPTTPSAAAVAAGFALAPEVVAVHGAICTDDRPAHRRVAHGCRPVLTALLLASERWMRVSHALLASPETTKGTCDMSVYQTPLRPPSRVTSALAGKVVNPERAGFDEVSMSAGASQAIEAFADVAGARKQLPPLTVKLRHLVRSMMGAQRV